MVSASSYIPPFYFYQFAQAISAPYSSLNAYKSEIIDENGNILKPESSVDPFEYLVIKLKKIFDMLPGNLTKAQLKNYFTALQYFTEEAKQYNLAQNELSLFIEGYVSAITDGKTSYLELVEDMSAGGMAAPAEKPESTGGVVGYDPVMAMGLQRRKQPKYFDNCEIFDVCPEEFIQFKAAKTWQDIPEGENKTYLQRFQRRNSGKKIAIKSLNPLNGESELHWITYPSKNFMEEFKLESLSILKEAKDIFVDRDEFANIADITGEKPVEPSPKGVKEVLSAQQQAVENAEKAKKRPAERFERQASLDASIASMGELEGLIRSSDPSDTRLASDWLTLAKHFAERSTSSNTPYDGVLLGRNNSGRVSPLLYDAKTSRWSAVTEVPNTSELVSVEPEDDPFNLWASAVEHGGNIDFEENQEQIEKANKLAKEMQKSPEFQKKARELAATKATSKYPVMTNLLRGRVFTPKQIGEILQGAVGNLRGREFRPNRLGRSVSGLRVGPYREALRQYERSIENWEQETPQTRVAKPQPPNPVKFRPTISTVSDALTISDLEQMENIPGRVYVPSAEDVRSAIKMLGKEVYERLFKS